MHSGVWETSTLCFLWYSANPDGRMATGLDLQATDKFMLLLILSCRGTTAASEQQRFPTLQVHLALVLWEYLQLAAVSDWFWVYLCNLNATINQGGQLGNPNKSKPPPTPASTSPRLRIQATVGEFSCSTSSKRSPASI